MPLFRRSTRCACAVAALWLAATPAASPAQNPARPDTLIGRVTAHTTAGPISGALVFVTRGPDRLVQQDTSDADGRWRLVFSPGTGDYLVCISSPGAESFRQRVTRTGVEQRFAVDAVLKSGAVAQLAAVRVQAQAPRPQRTDRTSPLPTTGSNERIAEGVFAAVSPTSAGSPLAIAATLPGLIVGPGGVSALGAGGDQSLVTLNGLASGVALPREARTRTRGSLSNYDPAIGGFSGALVSQELEAGREDTRRQSSFTLDAPQLRTGDPLASAYGLRPVTFQASLGQTGQLVDDRVYYAAALQASRRSAAQASLLTAPASVLTLDGLTASDVTSAQSQLANLGVNQFGATPRRIVDQFNVVGQLDRTPRGTHALRLTGLVDARRSAGESLAPSTLPDAGSSDQVVSAAVQFGSSAVIGTARPVLNDFRTSLSVQSSNQRAATAFSAAGVVRVPDLVNDPADPSVSVPTLAFGAFSGPTGARTNVTWEIANDVSWLRGARTHLFKLHGWTRIDGVHDETVADRNGTYIFNSLGDLTARRPAAFTRTLSQPARDGTVWNGAAAFAHRWAPSRVFQLLWGARVEGNRFLGAPARNTALESALNLRTDAQPSAIAISPRVGLTWYLVRDQAGGISTNTSDLATRSTLPVGMIRAGVGEFRGLYRADALAAADGATGLPDAFRRLTCVGASAPAVVFGSVTSAPIPSACAPGAPSLADATPPASLVGSGYRPPRNWRASAGWTSRLARVDYRVDATYALNLNQASVIDRNLITTPAFTLSSESGRAVFVPAASIDPASGGVQSAAARVSSSFGGVVERVGDLRGRAKNVTISLNPDLSGMSNGNLFVNVNYTWASARSAARGFDAGTAGDPRTIEWARSPFDVRHQVITQVARSFRSGIGLSMFLALQSGLPFTPLVASDINGDGRVNDRAFIPTAASPEIDALVSDAPSAVARCLRSQRGQIAARNSCDGAWSQTMAMRLDLPGRMLRLPQRARVALQFANPLGAIDQVLHGSDGLRGWGSASTPNPVLLVPRGYNTTTGAFRYDVNTRFGETRASRVTRPLDPYGITLDVRMDLSVPAEEQELRRQLKPGRSGDRRPRLSSDSLLRRYQRSMPSLFTAMQSLSDTLLLTPVQVDSLALREARYRATLDSIYRPLASYLAELPDAYDGGAALTKVQAADSTAWDVTFESGTLAKGVLSPVQLTIVPEFLKRIMDESPAAMRRDHARYRIEISPQGSSFSMDRR
jgi:Carboxypeptidase regulatory-like domain